MSEEKQNPEDLERAEETTPGEGSDPVGGMDPEASPEESPSPPAGEGGQPGPPREESPSAAPEDETPSAPPEEEPSLSGGTSLFEGDPGVEDLHKAVDAALFEGPSGSAGEEGPGDPAGVEDPGRTEESSLSGEAREIEMEEDEEDYEFDLEGISLDDPSESAAPPPPPSPSKTEAAARPLEARPPGLEEWPEDEREGRPLLASLKEKLQAIPRRKLAVGAVLLLAPLLAVLFLGLPTRKIERVPNHRIPDAVAPRRPVSLEGEIPRAVPGYLPPVESRRSLPPPAKDRPPLWAAAEQKAAKGDYAGAIILLEKFLAGNPPLGPEEKSGAWYDLSRWYRKVGDKETSRRYFSMALDTTWSSLGPKDLFLGGLELHKAGKYRQARRYFAAFLLQEDLMVPELKKKIAQAWFLLAEGYRLEAEAGEKAQERREEALQKAAGGGEGKKR